MSAQRDVVVLGGGLCGLAAATQLGDRAVVLERDSQPGGLARCVRLGRYWFDHVLHLLYFWDEETERLVTGLLRDDLSRCPPVAWVETSQGTARYPIQLHLGTLNRDAVARCLDSLLEVSCAPTAQAPQNFEELLRRGFGDALFDLFMGPYNRKLWKRPLDGLSPSGFQWNIPRPDVRAVILGALDPGSAPGDAYNARGFYPRPAADAAVRGMEVLSRALARYVEDLRLGHHVEAIVPERRQVRVRHGDVVEHLSWSEACLSTVPLPMILGMCEGVPETLRDAARTLQANRVVMVYVAIEGARPALGHWRYYADETLSFNRLVFMHEFDPGTAPDGGWGLMCELTERSEEPLGCLGTRVTRALEDAIRVGVLGPEHRVLETAVRVFSPAYVAFTPESQKVRADATNYLRTHGITPLGRYGRWEYSSMAQVMRDGFSWGRQLADRLCFKAPAQIRWTAPPAPGTSPWAPGC